MSEPTNRLLREPLTQTTFNLADFPFHLAMDIFNEQEQERYAMERSGKQQLSTEGAGAHADNVAE